MSRLYRRVDESSGGAKMSNLAAIRDLVEGDLDDAGNGVWSATEIERGVAKALNDYSRVNPDQAVDTIPLALDGGEVDLSSVSGLIRVVRVWWPYTASDPGYPPQWVRWTKWGDTLHIISEREPQSGDVVRVFFHKAREIEDLDGAMATTVPQEDEELIVRGAAAYCALQKARGAVGEAGVSAETPEHWLNWGAAQMELFREGLREVRRRCLAGVDKRAPLWREGWARDGQEEGI
jgi:hypothetical protein